MQVQNIIRASADVLTITSLSPGDVYKRVGDTNYSGDATLHFGVVQSVMNNGEDAAVTALEYETDYSVGIKATLKVFTGGKPIAIFPATPAEITKHLTDLHAATVRSVETAERDLETKRKALAAVEALTATVGELTEPNVIGEVTA
jgi:hypothetical protein